MKEGTMMRGLTLALLLSATGSWAVMAPVPVDEKTAEREPARFPEWASQRLETMRGEVDALEKKLEGKEGRRPARARRDLYDVKERVMWASGRVRVLPQEEDQDKARKEVREEIDDLQGDVEYLRKRVGD